MVTTQVVGGGHHQFKCPCKYHWHDDDDDDEHSIIIIIIFPSKFNDHGGHHRVKIA